MVDSVDDSSSSGSDKGK